MFINFILKKKIRFSCELQNSKLDSEFQSSLLNKQIILNIYRIHYKVKMNLWFGNHVVPVLRYKSPSFLKFGPYFSKRLHN